MKTLLTVAIVLMLTGSADVVRGDGGAVQVFGKHGDLQVTVFTDPVPLRVGPIDVSVLLQDAATGATIADAEIFVMVYPAGAPWRATGHIAGRDQAVNKLMRAAEFEVAESGPTEFEVIVTRAKHDDVHVRFQADVAPALPRWVAYWPWFTWPVVAVVVFALRSYVGGDFGRRHRL